MINNKLEGLEDLRMLSSIELAEILGNKPATLRSWRKRNIGPNYIKADGERGQVRYMVQDVRNWIALKRTLTEQS